jgi:hypothetical protein
MRRFSIATLIVVVLLCGVAVAALKQASDVWVGVLLAITLLLLGIALLGALQRKGASRAFWQGFAIFGWGYLVLTMGPWFREQVGARLVTFQLLDYLHAKAHADDLQAGDFEVIARKTMTPKSGTSVVIWERVSSARISLALALSGSNLDQFHRIGDCLFALLCAFGGGFVGRWFHRTEREGSQDTR